MKSGRALVAEITDIDRQHTPTARLCSPRAIRSKKSKAWFHELKECIRFISKLSSYLGFRVANTFTFEYWSSEQLDGEHDSLPFLCTWRFCKIFKNRRHALISFNPLLVSHFVFEPHLGLLEKTTPTFKKAFVWLKVEIESHIFLIYFARSKILSLRDHVTFRTWSCACVCEGWMSFWVVFDFGFSILPLGPLLFFSSRL